MTLQLATRIQGIRNYEDEFYSWKFGTIRRRRFCSLQGEIRSIFVANNIGIVAEDATDAIQKAAEQRKVAVTISLIGKKTYAKLSVCRRHLLESRTTNCVTY